MTELIRALGVVRLSIERVNTTSPARQKEIISLAAAARGREIVVWAEDLTVSAFTVHPMNRPDLADKLATTSDEWEEIWFWRQDRFVRGPGDLSDMIRWCDDHDKGLVSATENFDLRTPMGEAWAYIAAIFAKMESVATSERVLGSHQYLRENGRWGGGVPPYGYVAVPNPDTNGWVLAIDPEAAAVAIEAVRRIIEGESVQSIATDFNRRGLMSPGNLARVRRGRELVTRQGNDTSGRPWRATSLNLILRNPALLGYVTHGTQLVQRNGRQIAQRATVASSDGTPLIRADPIISETDWDRLQERLNDLSQAQRKTRKHAPSLLLHVAYCGHCRSPMYRRLYTRHGHDYAYYKCHRSTRRESTTQMCPTMPINGPWLDGLAEDIFLTSVGDVEIMRREFQRGSDSADLAAMLRRSLATARREYDSGGYTYPGGQAEYEERITGLSDRLREAAGKETTPDGYVDVPTGQTYREMWLENPEPAVRRRFMAQAGFRIDVSRTREGTTITCALDPDLARRAGLVASGMPVTMGERPWGTKITALDNRARNNLGEVLTAIGVGDEGGRKGVALHVHDLDCAAADES